jgi:hypothetical protein
LKLKSVKAFLKEAKTERKLPKLDYIKEAPFIYSDAITPKPVREIFETRHSRNGSLEFKTRRPVISPRRIEHVY